MGEFLLVVRCGLAVVFAVAAVAKLADVAGFRATLDEFGVAPSAARVGAIAVPVTELAIAVLLVPTATARAGAIAALSLLALFCIAIARVLRRGGQPDCNCFGKAQSSPVGRPTLARNAALGGLASLVAAAGPGGGLNAPPVAIVIAAALAVQAWFSWQLFRQHGRLLERVRTLEASAEAPPAGLTVIHRHRVRPDSLDQRVRALGG